MTITEVVDVSADAEHGEKMIQLRIRFFTNNLAPEGRIIPGHAYTCGTVYLAYNEAHGIEPATEMFYSLLDIGAAIERLLIGARLTLHPSPMARKYMGDAV